MDVLLTWRLDYPRTVIVPPRVGSSCKPQHSASAPIVPALKAEASSIDDTARPR
jgi:hypothetical protein